MVKLKISKEQLEREEELVSDRVYGDIEHYHYDNSVNRVDIDTGKGAIDIYIDGKRVKPKRYVLPMPDGTPDELDEGKYLAVHESFGTWHGSERRYDITKTAELEYFSVTQADIDAAPNWVRAITPVEVTDHEQ